MHPYSSDNCMVHFLAQSGLLVSVKEVYKEGVEAEGKKAEYSKRNRWCL